ALTVPLMVWVATLEVSAAVLMVTTGAWVSRVSTTGWLVPTLPTASVSRATMECAPSPDSVMLVLQTPPWPTVAVLIWLVTPLRVSNSVTMVPGAASPALTVPLMVWVATLEVSALVLMVTTGAWVSRVNTTALLVPTLPTASMSWATMEWAPSPDSVTLVLQAPPSPTVAVPIWLVTPLMVSNSVTMVPGSPALTVTLMVWVAT